MPSPRTVYAMFFILAVTAAFVAATSAATLAAENPVIAEGMAPAGDGDDTAAEPEHRGRTLARWSELTWPPIAFTPPPGRSRHSAIFDPARRRMIVFGGRDESRVFDDMWTLTLTEPSRWTRLRVAGGPGPRWGHAAVYDPVRDRMLVFGGASPSGVWSSEVWALSLSSSSWSLLPVSGVSPEIDSPALIYDPVRDRVLALGPRPGFAADAYRAWALPLAGDAVWTELVGPGPTLPPGRPVVYDSRRDGLLIVADDHLHGVQDVWTLALAETPSWNVIRRTGYCYAEPYSPALYDSHMDRVLVWTRYRMMQFPLSDISYPLWGPLRWINFDVFGDQHPSFREGGSMVHDGPGDRIVLFGGHDDGHRSDTWTAGLYRREWQPIVARPRMPRGRGAHVAAYDPRADRMIVFGDAGYMGERMHDAWVLSLGRDPAWEPVVAAGTAPGPGRYGGVFDPVRRRLLVYATAYASPSEIWSLELERTPTWRLLLTVPPSLQLGLGGPALYDPVHDRMVVLNLSEDPATSDRLSCLDLRTLAWSTVTIEGQGPPRRGGSAVAYDSRRRRMILFGGGSESDHRFFNDVWAVTLGHRDRAKWVELSPLGEPPSSRIVSAMVYDPARHRMVVHGGLFSVYDPENDGSRETYLNDTWVLSLSGRGRWERLEPEGVPPISRILPSLIHDPSGDRAVLFGGLGVHRGPRELDDTWMLSFRTRRHEHRVATEPHMGEGPAPAEGGFALHGASPNPAVRELAIGFSLPDAAPARLAIYSVSGRLVRSLDVGAMGPGRHRVAMSGENALAPGIYFVRLTRGRESRVSKIAVVR
jgi:hypothetical protein